MTNCLVDRHWQSLFVVRRDVELSHHEGPKNTQQNTTKITHTTHKTLDINTKYKHQKDTSKTANRVFLLLLIVLSL